MIVPPPGLPTPRGTTPAAAASPKRGTASGPHRRTIARSRRGLASLLLLLSTALVPGAMDVEPEHPFRFGFSGRLMSTMNENDSQAAMKAWAVGLVKSGALDANPSVLFCRDFATMREALLARQVDGVAILTAELYALRGEVPFNRYVFGVMDGEITDEYVLLVHRSQPYARLADLHNKALRLHANPRLALALPWLDTVLLGQGLKPASEFFRAIEEDPKLAKTTLPVFFQTTDACLITRKGFAAMAEMNPQVGRQLRILTNSIALLPSGFFFRQGYPQTQQNRCLQEFTSIHATPTGQQVLTVFQTQRLEEHPPSVLDPTFALLETHRRLTDAGHAVSPATTAPPADAAGVPHPTEVPHASHP